MKKANEGREGQTKARGSTISKFYNFYTSMGLFGVINVHVSLLLSFKAKKVKKAALVARNTKLQTGNLVSSKMLKKTGQKTYKFCKRPKRQKIRFFFK